MAFDFVLFIRSHAPPASRDTSSRWRQRLLNHFIFVYPFSMRERSFLLRAIFPGA